MSMNKIVIPDAAIRDFNERYGKYLPKDKPKAPTVDEDELYLKYFVESNNGER